MVSTVPSMKPIELENNATKYRETCIISITKNVIAGL